eukprot:TRINITY_DN19631_c0_g1_i1.p1 TRINITY_DN19631_c0_g1~~TRINITY_DN19631_c0_g1_i1.p1  ORF type:complete len:544 (+),score=170.68 TRINITY_DN19631_c0_g1_i1:83-1633(+)
MAAVLCCISGVPPEEPVVSRKTGHVFERRLIEKHLVDTQKCPVTDEDLAASDLLPIKVSPAPKPRPATAQSIPGMLAAFQNEWDAVMLESYQLKKQLDTARQELSHALYQHDAACRVIARLIGERDAARRALGQAQAIREAESSAQQGNPEAAAAGGGLPAPVLAHLTEVSQQLTARRRKRVQSPSLASPDEVSRFVQEFAVAPHSAASKGVLCCAVADGGGLATGGADGGVVIFGSSGRQVAQRINAHGKGVRQVIFVPSGGSPSGGLVSCSDDCTVRLWTREGEGDFKQAASFEDSKAVTGVSLNASGEYFASCSLDSSWSLHDIGARKRMLTVRDTDGTVKGGWSCIGFHPDGLLLGMGTEGGGDNAVCVWDLKNVQVAAKFASQATVRTMSFSENGYHLATGADDGVCCIWDLRKLQVFQTLTFDDSDPANPTPVSRVRFDHSGCYLAAATRSLKLLGVKKEGVTEFAVLRDAEDTVTDVQWGPDAKWLVTTGMDRQLRLFSAAPAQMQTDG